MLYYLFFCASPFLEETSDSGLSTPFLFRWPMAVDQPFSYRLNGLFETRGGRTPHPVDRARSIHHHRRGECRNIAIGSESKGHDATREMELKRLSLFIEELSYLLLLRSWGIIYEHHHRRQRMVVVVRVVSGQWYVASSINHQQAAV